MMFHLQVSGLPELERAILKLDAALNTQEILDEGAAVLFNRVRTRFLAQTDPEGHRWPPSKASLLRAKRNRGGGTLFDTGDLFRSLQVYVSSENTREIGTNVTSPSGFPYPIVHNFGLAGFPRREFLGFAEEDLNIMSRVIMYRIVKALG
jgi:Mu-like prophage protein gpG